MPILKEGQLDIFSRSDAHTQRLGQQLGLIIQPRDVVCLSGEMGSGKTALSIGIGESWGTQTPISSPTYNLVHQHTRIKDDQRLYHIDCYRLDNSDDLVSIGFDDIVDDPLGTLLIEWAENIEDVLPPENLWIDVEVLDNKQRKFTFEATGKRYRELLLQFRKRTYGG